MALKKMAMFNDEVPVRVKRFLLVILLCSVLSSIWYNNVVQTHTRHGSMRRLSEDVIRIVQNNLLGSNTTRYTGKDKRYDFVYVTKNADWDIIPFPCRHICEKYNVSVTISLAPNVSDIVGADVVIFGTVALSFEEWQSLQHFRAPGQIWVFGTQEPAAILPHYLPPAVYRYSTYNWSFTFHHKSDINGAYGWYTPEQPKKQIVTNWFKEKSKFAAWVSSRHCDGLGWDRTKFVKDLAKSIPIDMYGDCGKIALVKKHTTAKIMFKQYKFFLSLENSCCSEYLSEKVWNALEHWESVPIVIGGTKEEYKKLMPPYSYIHADDFRSMADLARYINKVGANETLYNEYFYWRNKGSVHQQSFQHRFPVFKDGVCKIIGKIEKLKESPRIYSFDPYGPDWFGSCYRCGNYDWIQNYNIWSRRTRFSKKWEDNRTLYWLDGGNAST